MIDRVLILSLGGCAIFGTLLFLELTSADPNQPAKATTPAQVEPPAAARPQRQPIDELVAASLSRPLFSATRKPPERATADRTVDQQLPNLRLTGIVIEPSRHLAIFAAAGAKPLVRSEGETVDEWRLDSVAPRQVSLSGRAGIMTLEPKPDPNINRRSLLKAQPVARSGPPVTPGRQGVANGHPPLPVIAGPQPTPAPMPQFRVPTEPPLMPAGRMASPAPEETPAKAIIMASATSPERVPEFSATNSMPAPAKPPEDAAPIVAVAPGPLAPDPTPVVALPVPMALPGVLRASTAESSALRARGDSLFGVGDVASARLFYERAIDAGDAPAALRLGETYDPLFLALARLNGVRGDLAVATRWYRRARDLGASEAEILLKSAENR